MNPAPSMLEPKEEAVTQERERQVRHIPESSLSPPVKRTGSRSRPHVVHSAWSASDIGARLAATVTHPHSIKDDLKHVDKQVKVIPKANPVLQTNERVYHDRNYEESRHLLKIQRSRFLCSPLASSTPKPDHRGQCSSRERNISEHCATTQRTERRHSSSHVRRQLNRDFESDNLSSSSGVISPHTPVYISGRDISSSNSSQNIRDPDMVDMSTRTPHSLYTNDTADRRWSSSGSPQPQQPPRPRHIPQQHHNDRISTTTYESPHASHLNGTHVPGDLSQPPEKSYDSQSGSVSVSGTSRSRSVSAIRSRSVTPICSLGLPSRSLRKPPASTGKPGVMTAVTSSPIHRLHRSCSVSSSCPSTPLVARHNTPGSCHTTPESPCTTPGSLSASKGGLQEQTRAVQLGTEHVQPSTPLKARFLQLQVCTHIKIIIQIQGSDQLIPLFEGIFRRNTPRRTKCLIGNFRDVDHTN